MKFMKLGSKPDQFKADEGNIRYVATELAADLVITVGDVKFYLHKFPLLSKCSKLQKLISAKNEEHNDEIEIHDIPGGAASFEICAKFCYGMIIILNAYNVVAARCAAEYLEMYESVEKGNIIYKIDVFLSSSILRSWKDSIIVLQTTRSFLPWSEELKLISHCLDSISSKASMDPSRVDWSYTYSNREKLLSENQNDPKQKQHAVPRDWWVEDLCELSIDLFKRVVTTIRAKGRVDSDIIGEALVAFTLRRLDSFNPKTMQESDSAKYRYLVDTITWLLPKEKRCVPCNFLLKLLQASLVLGCGEKVKAELVRRNGQQLDEANVSDFHFHSTSGESTLFDVDTVYALVEQFVIMQERIHERDRVNDQELQGTRFSADDSKSKVARLVDGYLAEAARDSSLPLDKFFELAQAVSNFPRPNHDAIYRAIDMYLKEHPGLSKSEKKRICRLMDCRKLSTEACAHAVQNERLPLRVVVQVLFFEQAKSATNGSGNSTPNLGVLAHKGSYTSSSSAATSSEEDWEGDRKSKELVNLRESKCSAEKFSGKKGKKLLSKLWSGKEREGDNNSSSDTCESPGSNSALEQRKDDPQVKKAAAEAMHYQALKRFYGQREEDVKSLGR